MPDYGMTEREFVDKMERQLTAIFRLWAQRFGAVWDYDVKLVKRNR
jgi:hypothetical protein